ncbi:hypothetical protein [Vagococcus fluvialis]|uniref:hypothetical protein n=1 Tax=Vagococcus fluvialis TaxID=2738 RepID=UPI001D0A8213|nr:hypothetical protein [Vagococcus fluvialis]UDM72683.1 hypothetical protein K5L00_14955 [Vagococcus fluvialis]UDM78406.1 hypothetical protein K5K98_14290 [Vagococcus fluvialis]UDM83958.1 hypothetical protein K5K96_14980 [Vagococcus fluvialis]
MKQEKILVTEGMENFLNENLEKGLSLNVLWEEFCEDSVNFQAHIAEKQFSERDTDDLITMAIAIKFGYTSDPDEVREDPIQIKHGLIEVPKFIMEMIEYHKQNHAIMDLERSELNNYICTMFYLSAYTLEDVSASLNKSISAKQREYIRENLDDLKLGLSRGFKLLQESRFVLHVEGNPFDELFEDQYLDDFKLSNGYISTTSYAGRAYRFGSHEEAKSFSQFLEGGWSVKEIKVEVED